jgi:hypothetical protein
VTVALSANYAQRIGPLLAAAADRGLALCSMRLLQPSDAPAELTAWLRGARPTGRFLCATFEAECAAAAARALSGVDDGFIWSGAISDRPKPASAFELLGSDYSRVEKGAAELPQVLVCVCPLRRFSESSLASLLTMLLTEQPASTPLELLGMHWLAKSSNVEVNRRSLSS